MTVQTTDARGARISSEVRAIAELPLPALRAEWIRRWGEAPSLPGTPHDWQMPPHVLAVQQ